MKLTLDFDIPKQVRVTASDDSINSYTLKWNDANEFSLWYNNNLFVWNKEYADIESAVASLIGNLLSAMKKNI